MYSPISTKILWDNPIFSYPEPHGKRARMLSFGDNLLPIRHYWTPRTPNSAQYLTVGLSSLSHMTWVKSLQRPRQLSGRLVMSVTLRFNTSYQAVFKIEVCISGANIPTSLMLSVFLPMMWLDRSFWLRDRLLIFTLITVPLWHERLLSMIRLKQTLWLYLLIMPI